jgi:hypothetical protein
MYAISRTENKKIIVNEEELSMLQEKLYCLSSQICLLSGFLPYNTQPLGLSKTATEGLKYSLQEFSKQAEEMGDRLSSFL